MSPFQLYCVTLPQKRKKRSFINVELPLKAFTFKLDSEFSFSAFTLSFLIAIFCFFYFLFHLRVCVNLLHQD